MPKRSDIEAQIAALQEQLEAADSDEELEIWVENRDGHRTKLSGKRAESWLRRNGYEVDEVDSGEVVEPKADKKTPAKKAPAKKDEQPEENEETPESDEPPAPSHRFFRK